MRLRELIRAVRACKTAAEERQVISQECALIRTAFKEENEAMRHRNVAKLLYIHMLGYPSHWGQMEAVKLIATPTFPEKRMGYLTLMLLLTEKEEVLMLVTNSMKNDLNHSNQHVAGLALTACGNLATAEMARDVAGDVKKLLHSTNPYLRKKACLTTIRILDKVPELIEDFTESITSILKDRNHGVLVAGVQCMISLLERHAEVALPVFRPLVPSIIRMLRTLLASGFEPEHTVAGITDPFLQVKILHILYLLGRQNDEASESMNDILAQTATHTETAKNAGNAILYECVMTILKTEAEAGLRLLAVNILGRFLQNRDNNIRYVGLNTLSKIVGDDVLAVQRHRPMIVDCLKDPDASIRARAVELLLQIVDSQNVQDLISELLNYLVVAGSDQKADLCSRMVEVIEKFAPTPKWRVECLITMLSIAGSFCADEITNVTILYILQAEKLVANIAHKLFLSLDTDMSQLALVHVGIWCIGEYGELLLEPCPAADVDSVGYEPHTEEEVVTLIERITKLHSATSLTRAYILNAAVKLSTRFSTSELERIKGLIMLYSESMTVELQQRACEYLLLLQPGWEQVRKEAMTKMPIPDDISTKKRRAQFEPSDSGTPTAGLSPAIPSATGDSGLGNIMDSFPAFGITPPAGKPTTGAAGNDLINLEDIFGSSGPIAPAPVPFGGAPPVQQTQNTFGMPPIPAFQQQPAAPAPGANLLQDLFASTPAPVMTPSPGAFTQPAAFGASFAPAVPLAAPPVSMPPPPVNPTMTVFDKNGLNISIDLSKPNPTDASITQAVCKFVNSSSTDMTNLVFQAAVPKYMRLEMRPPSSTTVPPHRAETVTQVMILNNSMHGQKGLMLKMKLQVNIGANSMDEMVQVSNFPENF